MSRSGGSRKHSLKGYYTEALIGGCAYRHEKKTSEGSVWLPCGKCLRCRKQQQSEVMGRIMAEAVSHKSSAVFTLTFNELEYEKQNVQNWTKKDVLKANKALRHRIKYHWPEWSGRYHVAWELGEQNGRLHVHITLFGIPIMYPKQQVAYPEWWKSGRVVVDQVTPKSASYVSDYVSKPEKRILRVHTAASNHLGAEYQKQFLLEVNGLAKWRGAVFKYTRPPLGESYGQHNGPYFEVDFRKYPLSRHVYEWAKEQGFDHSWQSETEQPQTPQERQEFVNKYEELERRLELYRAQKDNSNLVQFDGAMMRLKK